MTNRQFKKYYIYLNTCIVLNNKALRWLVGQNNAQLII